MMISDERQEREPTTVLGYFLRTVLNTLLTITAIFFTNVDSNPIVRRPNKQNKNNSNQIE